MQTHFSNKNIIEMEQRQRAVFINSLGGFKSVCLVGTKNNQNQTNLSIISSLVHIGSSPALFGMIIRPGVVERHTLENILETKYYTVKKGDNLGEIADKYNVAVSDVKKWNQLKGTNLKTGAKLKIKYEDKIVVTEKDEC